MKNSELIKLLQTFPADIEVATQCICSNYKINGAEIDTKIERLYVDQNDMVGVLKEIGPWLVLK